MDTTVTLYRSEAFAEYLIIKGFTKKTQATISNAVKSFATWTTIENTELQNISYNDVLAYINHCKKKGNKQRTLQVITNCIKHYYNFCSLKKKQQITPVPMLTSKG